MRRRMPALPLALAAALATAPLARAEATAVGAAAPSAAAAPRVDVGRARHVPPGNVIRVKGVAGDTVLGLVPTEGGGLVSLAAMGRLLGGQLDSLAADRWRLTLYGTALELQMGSPFVGYNGFALPLHEPTVLVENVPHAPLQLFSEIIPRFGIGIIWDKARWEVRLFQGIARRPTPASSRETGETAVATVANGTPAAPRVTTVANSPPAAPRVAAPTGPAGLSRRYVIAVDAGHGGNDPGNPGVVIGGRRVNESKLTLAMALALDEELRKRGLDVVMTRKRDTLIARDDRGPIANRREANLFISLHTNAANPNWKNGSAVRGVETYFLSTARTEDERRVAAMENDVLQFESNASVSKGDPLSFILSDLAQNEHLRESFDLASVVQRRLAGKHPGPNRGVKQAGFAVLATAYMPAILVEVGFGTNLSDARWMASAEGQRDIAVAIADAVVEYLEHYERRTGAGGR